ncbi:MAG: proline racemase family protein [Alphaproteobacteria bacterium]
MERVAFIDSHTGGEPTRLILEGGPDLGSGALSERARLFRSRHDNFRSGVVEEPRGSDVFVGALLCTPENPAHTAGVIFFNNVDLLGMCGHGMIGVIASLYYLGRIEPGRHVVETPVGPVEATLTPEGDVSINNVPSYRFRTAVSIPVDGLGELSGDVAWGGNWFFLSPAPQGLDLEFTRVDELVDASKRVREALERDEIRGADGAKIDHIELYAPSPGDADVRTFVLCPGGAWDRSPCGTGTSAKMACLAADGQLAPGEPWRQESVVGSVFEGRYQAGPGNTILPTITGSAYVMSEGFLRLGPEDPFRWGLS